jgi:hypothetical protein
MFVLFEMRIGDDCGSMRVHYLIGLEVEFGFASPDWTMDPVDPGTKQLVGGGLRLLYYDPEMRLRRLAASVLAVES